MQVFPLNGPLIADDILRYNLELNPLSFVNEFGAHNSSFGYLFFSGKGKQDQVHIV